MLQHFPQRPRLTRTTKQTTVMNAALYAALVIVIVAVASLRWQVQGTAQNGLQQYVAQPSLTLQKPYYSLSTNRSFATNDAARIWLNYRNIDHLDFLVYRITEPVSFFKRLSDPHQIGAEEKTEVASSYKRNSTLLENLHSFKASILRTVKRYLRGQLRQESRTALSDKVYGEGKRMPLNVANYARVKFLNPNQLVSSWREQLPPLYYEYDSRIVKLGKREAGLYLIDAVNGNLHAYTIVLVTDLTMVSKTSPLGDMTVFAVDRKTGAPRAGAVVEVFKKNQTLLKGVTDQNGIFKNRFDVNAIFPKLPPEPPPPEDYDPQEYQREDRSILVSASVGDEFTISDLSAYSFGVYDYNPDYDRNLTSYIYTDRPIYRPAQRVYFKGILRNLKESGYEMVPGKTVTVRIEDPNSTKLLEKEIPLSSRGTFSGDVEISETAVLGGYRIIATTAARAITNGYFEVQEYKKPEYKVNVTASTKFARVGSRVRFSVAAKYFFGAPVAGADLHYYIYRSRYYPPWWEQDYPQDDQFASGEEDSGYYSYGYGKDLVKEASATLKPNGTLDVDFAVPPADAKDPYDYSYQIEAQVTDASRRQIMGSADFVGTRGTIMADASPERYLYTPGETAKIRVRTSSYEGHPVSASVTLKFIERTWIRKEIDNPKVGKYESDYAYEPKDTELSSAQVTTTQQGEGSYQYATPQSVSASDQIIIKCFVNEGNQEIAFHDSSLWFVKSAYPDESPGDYYYGSIYRSMKIVPDKKQYNPGETAHVLALLPEENTHLFITTEQKSITNAWHIEAHGRSATIDIPIEERYAPNIYISITFVKNGDMHSQDSVLVVPAAKKILNVEVMSNKREYKPRESASYTVLVRNTDGSPAAGAEVSLGVVDEAIYSIRTETGGDIRKSFYGRRYNAVQTRLSIPYYFSGYSGEKPFDIAGSGAGKKRDAFAGFKNESQYAEPTIRKEFKDTAFWQPDVITGADGKANVKVNLPDNLTTWRATVRAVTEDTRVGSTIGRVTARKDLILRVETPRFMTEGDTATFSGIVHNYLKTDKSARVSIEVTGAQVVGGSNNQTVTIASDGEFRTDWRVNAVHVGDVRILAKALTDTESDGVEFSLPIIPRGLERSKGDAVVVSDENTDQTITYDLPPDTHAQARFMRIEAAPSIAATLFSSLDYLTGYPYGCTEQTMSRFLPNIIVAQALQEVKTASIRASNNLDKKVARGFDQLYSYQHADGGWGWWKNDETDPFMTAYVIDGLALAIRAGYAADANIVARGREKLKSMLEKGRTDKNRPIDAETRAYVIYALNESGYSEPRLMLDLFNKRNGLQPFGRALLALAFKQSGDQTRAAQLAEEIERTVRVNDFDAHWESRRREALDFTQVNDTEATAMSLKALANIKPSSQLLPKAARWLISNRHDGYYWQTTEKTAFAIYGLIDYLKVSKELSPDYSVEIYLNDQQVLTRRMTADDVASAQTFVIERKGAELSRNNRLRIVKRGRGTLYLSNTVRYYIDEAEVAAQSTKDLRLKREYLRLRVDEGSEGTPPRWRLEPLSGELRSGDLIVARLVLEGSRAQYIMIEDPIPAGCEPIARISGIDLDYSDNDWSDWYSAREFHDQKTALFVNSFDGKARFQYAMRVLVPGEFHVAPARAELMYQPTIQSNTATTNIKILDKR